MKGKKVYITPPPPEKMTVPLIKSYIGRIMYVYFPNISAHIKMTSVFFTAIKTVFYDYNSMIYDYIMPAHCLAAYESRYISRILFGRMNAH